MNLIDFFSHPVFFASGMALVHSLWQILLIAAIWRSAIYLTRNFPAAVRYYVSLISFLSIPLIFIITFIRQLTEYTAAESSIPGNYSEILKLIRHGGNAMVMQETDPGFTRYVEIYSPLIFWLYLIVVVFLTWKSLLGYADVRSLQTNGTSALPGTWISRIKGLVITTGLQKRVTILLSSGVSVPMVTGFIKPVILLPLAIFSSLQVHQVEAILLHELYHVRKYDHIINAIQNFLEILFFFHPATWWISSNLRFEREKRTDEWVVSVTHEPLVYARALVILETSRRSRYEAAVAAVNSKNELLTRIKNIMTMKSNKTNTGRKAAAMLVLSVAIISVAWFNPLKIDANNNLDIVNLNGFSYSPDSPIASSPVSDIIAEPVQDLQDKPATDTTNQRPENNESEGMAVPDELEEEKEIMQDNKEYEYQEFSDPELSEEIRQQMESAREAVKEAMEHINSEEFKDEMRQAREEIRKAMEELNSEEFKEEMRQAREDMKRAMQEINSEEFRQEMKQAQEEIRQAMQEINSEEFKMQMQLAGEQMKKAMQEINSEEFQEQMRQAREQMNEALQEIDSDEFREQMRQVQERIKEAAREIEEEQPLEQPEELP